MDGGKEVWVCMQKQSFSWHLAALQSKPGPNRICAPQRENDTVNDHCERVVVVELERFFAKVQLNHQEADDAQNVRGMDSGNAGWYVPSFSKPPTGERENENGIEREQHDSIA